MEECEAIAKSDTRSTAPTTAAVEDDDDVEITQVAPAQETKHARAFSFLSRALPPPRPLHLRLRLPFFVLAACLLALSVSAIILRKQLDSAREGGRPLQGFSVRMLTSHRFLSAVAEGQAAGAVSER